MRLFFFSDSHDKFSAGTKKFRVRAATVELQKLFLFFSPRFAFANMRAFSKMISRSRRRT